MASFQAAYSGSASRQGAGGGRLVGVVAPGLEDGGHPARAHHVGTGGHQLGAEPLHRSGAGVHQHEGVDPVGVLQGHELGHHPAHRVAEQGEALPPEGVGHGQDVVGHRGQRVVERVGRMAAGPVAAMVEGDGVEAEGGQTIEPGGEVLLGAGEAVDDEEGTAAAPRLGDGEPETGHLEPALDHPKSPASPPTSVT